MMRVTAAVVLTLCAVGVVAQVDGECPLQPTPTPSPSPTPLPQYTVFDLLEESKTVVPMWMCPIVRAPTIYEMQDAFVRNSSYLRNNQAAPSIGSLTGRGATVMNEFRTSNGASHNVVSGVYSVDYVVEDTCRVQHRQTATLDYRCPPGPQVTVSDKTVTVQPGAEVLVQYYFTDPVDEGEDAIICVKSSPPTFDGGPILTTEDGVKEWVFTPNSRGSYTRFIQFRPYASGEYVFTIVLSDYCSATFTDVKVTVTLDECAPLDKPKIMNQPSLTVVWNDVAQSSYQTPVQARQTQAQEYCLPKNYVTTSALVGRGDFRSRFSPYVDAGTAGSRLLNTDEYDTLVTVSGNGCTWPGASNYNAAVETDDGSCTCYTTGFRWGMVDTMGSYNRWYPTSPSIPPVLIDNQTLVFYNEQPDSNMSMPELCKRTEYSSTQGGVQTRDLRIDATQVRRGMDYLSAAGAELERPSTSWDAMYTYKIDSATWSEWYSVTDSNSAWGENDVDCTIELTSSVASSATNTFKVTKGPGKSFKQCLGRYTFSVRSMQFEDLEDDRLQFPYASSPESDPDMAVLSVICPQPPFVQTLCHQEMLWNGTAFVRTSEVGTMDGWIRIDARDSYYPATSASITTAWKIVSAPPMVTFNGAGPSGGQKAVEAPVDLGNTADVQAKTGTGADDRIGLFKPTRGGQYDVSYSIDDGCNTPSFDNVTVMTECLRMTANPSILSTDAFEGPATTGATTTTKALVRIQPDATYEGPNRTLNYAWRLSSRPTFMGDSVPGGAFANLPATWPVNAGMAVGAECMLGENWDTQTIDRTLTSNFSLWLSTEVSLPIAGTYRFDQYVTDGCGMEKQTGASLSTTVSCGADTVDFSKDATQPDVNITTWNGASFPVKSWPTFEASATAGRHPTRYSFFLTAAPALDTAHVPFAGGSANTNGQNTPKALASDQQCDPWGNTWAVGAMSGAVAAASSPTAPFKILTGQSGSSKPKLGLTDLSLNAVGSYEVYIQGDNECSYVPKLYASFKTECNKPARLVCLATGASPSTAHLPMPSGTAGCADKNSGNGMTGGCIKGAAGTCDSQLSWDCVNARFPTSWINILADAGSDFGGFSENDVVTSATTLTAPSLDSWLSVEYATYSATWTIRVRDTALDSNPNTNTQGNRGLTLADGSGFSELLTDLTAGLPAKIALAASAEGYPVAEARVANLNVSIVDQGVGCFVPYWGRLFKVQADFNMLPPAHFAAPVTGQQAAFTAGADVRPYATFVADFAASAASDDLFYKMSMAVPNAEYFTGDRDAIPMSAQPSGSLNGTLTTPTRYPATLMARPWAAGMAVASAATPVKAFSSWYIPDMAGQYEASTSVQDNCPCTGADCPSQWTDQTNTMTYVATAKEPTCQIMSQPTVNITNFKTGQELSANPSFQWISAAKGFGDGWQYAAELTGAVAAGDAAKYTTLTPAYTTTGATASWKVECLNTVSPTSVSCVTGGSTSLNIGSQPNVGAIARLQRAAPSGSATRRAIVGTNGATVSFTVTGEPSLGNAPLQVGCVADGTTAVDISTVRFFASVTAIDTTTPRAVSFPLPDECKTHAAVDFVFYRAAYFAPAQYTIAGVTVKEHTAGVQLAPTCDVDYMYKSGTSAFDLGSSTAETITDAPLTNFPDTRGAAISGGQVGALPSTGFTGSLTFEVTEPRPSWFATTTCTQTSPAETITLTCRSLSLSTSSSGTLAFEGKKFQYPSASALTTPTYTIPTTDLNGLTYTYTVTSAPAGSMYNKDWIAANLVPSRITPSTESEMCFYSAADDLTYDYNRLGDYRTDVKIVSNKTTMTTYMQDTSAITVTLVNRALPDAQPEDSGKAELATYVREQLASTCFQPDVAGDYNLEVTVTDGCQTMASAVQVVTASACPVPTVAFSSTTGTVSGTTLTGVQSLNRIDLHASVQSVDTVWGTSGQSRVRNATWTFDSWPKSMSTFGPEDQLYKPTLLNGGSLYPSFIPSRPGTYVLSLHLDTGCMPALAPYTLTINVGCTPAATPAPMTAIFNDDKVDRGAISPETFVMPYQSGADFQFIGSPGCNTYLNSYWDLTSIKYQPASTWTVKITSVSPSIIASVSTSKAKQLVTVQFAVGGDTPGLPWHIVDPLYYRPDDAQDEGFGITIDGNTCEQPVVLSLTDGTVQCWMNYRGSAPVADAFTTQTVKVKADLMEYESMYFNGDYEMKAAVPYVTHTTTPDGASVWGGQTIRVHGVNLALSPALMTFFDISRTTITIGGQTCSNVAVGSASFAADGYLTCTLPQGYGTNLDVAVRLAFTTDDTGDLDTDYVTAQSAPVFSYDAPTATTVSPATGSGSGGYMATIQVSNLGPRDRFNPSSLLPSGANQASPDPYANLVVYVGGNSATAATVTVDETSASSPATITFWMPAGCGDAARVEVSRETVSRTMASQTTATFNYDDPVVLCLGEPYTDPSKSGCTSVTVDGRNLYIAPGFMVEFLDKDTGDVTDTCDYPSTNNVNKDIDITAVRFTCRVGNNASPTNTMRITNSCGETNTVTNADNMPALPNAVSVPSSINSVDVSSGSSFDTSQTTSALSTSTEVTTTGIRTKKWKNKPMSNGLFLGLAMPLILIVVIAYPVYVYFSRKNAGTATRHNVYERSTAGAATSGAATSGAASGSTRITRNPAARAAAPAATASRSAAPATPVRGGDDGL